MYLASVVNLGIIWCFGFFFLESLDDLWWGVQQRDDALASRDDVQKLGSIPTVSTVKREGEPGMEVIVEQFSFLVSGIAAEYILTPTEYDIISNT